VTGQQTANNSNHVITVFLQWAAESLTTPFFS